MHMLRHQIYSSGSLYHHCICLFFFNSTATTDIYTLSLHDALPISGVPSARSGARRQRGACAPSPPGSSADRKSTRLNSSHLGISYAVFCLKKKIKIQQKSHTTFHTGAALTSSTN